MALLTLLLTLLMLLLEGLSAPFKLLLLLLRPALAKSPTRDPRGLRSSLERAELELVDCAEGMAVFSSAWLFSGSELLRDFFIGGEDDADPDCCSRGISADVVRWRASVSSWRNFFTSSSRSRSCRWSDSCCEEDTRVFAFSCRRVRCAVSRWSVSRCRASRSVLSCALNSSLIRLSASFWLRRLTFCVSDTLTRLARPADALSDWFFWSRFCRSQQLLAMNEAHLQHNGVTHHDNGSLLSLLQLARGDLRLLFE
jgi:hypothetical protein